MPWMGAHLEEKMDWEISLQRHKHSSSLAQPCKQCIQRSRRTRASRMRLGNPPPHERPGRPLLGSQPARLWTARLPSPKLFYNTVVENLTHKFQRGTCESENLGSGVWKNIGAAGLGTGRSPLTDGTWWCFWLVYSLNCHLSLVRGQLFPAYVIGLWGPDPYKVHSSHTLGIG